MENKETILEAFDYVTTAVQPETALAVARGMLTAVLDGVEKERVLFNEAEKKGIAGFINRIENAELMIREVEKNPEGYTLPVNYWKGARAESYVKLAENFGIVCRPYEESVKWLLESGA